MKTMFSTIVVVFFLAAISSLAQAELVAHWPLDADGSDAAGQFDGTVDGSISFGSPGANGNTGGAASFSGAGGVQVPYDSALNPSSFTVTAWVNPSATAGWNSVVTSREDNGSTVNGYILYNSPDNQWDFWTGGGGPTGSWGTNPGPSGVLNEWTHLAISYDETTDTKILWVNGQNAAEVSGQGYVPNGTTPEFSRPFNIGAGADLGDTFFFTGLIDDVGLFDEALSAAVIQQVASEGVASIPEPASAMLSLMAAVSLLSLRRKPN